MKNKWLLISSVSTALGIIAGSVYLLFAEHSLLLSNNSWVLSAFWSAFVLWTFVLMFIVALIFNVMAFFELDDQRKFFGLRAPLSEMLTPKDRQQEFIKNAEHFLQQQGKLFHSSRVSSEFKCLQSSQDEKLVYLHRNDKSVDITQIRALFQQMLSADFKSGVVVSYAGFTSQAWIFAKEANIELLDAKGLKKQQKQHRTQQFALV
ncbi:restriction endonuclease [Rheinheimera baltica]|uniref:Restriction endonuclease n=1 Tax=Rheinheimera baltica TaxID=67576 RepID=A0ABT9HYS5_9GAMM|nr:restriction endonuclease [Rheinheimera baltica]MDP5135960.1 restriction endonuclease [Rheinheimera baltica]MDP5144352.1 restriction endonuclease [Rheinheimera baltica]MDP5151430.1 restriction endonuclease [Rheinheimera baltica]MDP5191395.1 restriction endonuclease [Rheinheimera baltica]